MKKFAVRLFFVVITNFLVFCSVGWADDVGVDPKADVHGFAGVHESLWNVAKIENIEQSENQRGCWASINKDFR